MRTVSARVAATLAITLITASCATGGGVDEAPAQPGEALSTEAAEAVAADPPMPAITVPDLTARPLSADQLREMLPTGAGGVADSAEPVIIHPRSNEDLITNAVFDREDEADDVIQFRRLSGIGASFIGRTYTAHAWIDVLEDSTAAHEYLLDTTGDAVKGFGGTHTPGTKALTAVEFPVSVGEESIGIVAGLEDGGTETIVMTRVGRMVVFASIERDDDRDVRVPAQYLAEETVDRVLSVLLGAAPEAIESTGPSSHTFSFDMRVTGPDDRETSLSAEGRTASGNISCRVRMDDGASVVDRDLVLANGTLWARDHGRGDYHAAGSGLVADRSLLQWCPAWPIDVVSSGLNPLLTSVPATADLESGPALGYRVDAAGLNTLLGEDVTEVQVEVFNVWLAEGTRWMVDLGLTATGTAGALDALFGTGFAPDETVTVTIRQRINDLESAEPISAPGL